MTRGSAATGYVCLHSILLAAGYTINASLFNNVQLDWEAILTQNPSDFVRGTETWLMEHLVKTERSGEDEVDWLDHWRGMGTVETAFNSYRKMYGALNIVHAWESGEEGDS